jgi:hypothetical protein
MKRIDRHPLSKEDQELLEEFREEAQQCFDSIGEGRGSRVEVGGISAGEFVEHPDLPGLWAYVVFDITGQSCFAMIGNDRSPASLMRKLDPDRPVDKADEGVLSLDLQQLEAEKVAKFVKSLWTQRPGTGRPAGPSEATRQKRLEWANDYYETQVELEAIDERPLTQEEFCADRGISVSTLQRALREASKQSEK